MKKYILQTYTTLVLLTFCIPLGVFAETTQTSECSSFLTLHDQLSIRFSLMQDKLTLLRSTVEERVQRRDTLEDDIRNSQREDIDSRLVDQFEDLRTKVNTENERIAVEEYISLTTQAHAHYRDVTDLNMTAIEYIDQQTLIYYAIAEGALTAYKTTVLEAIIEGSLLCNEPLANQTNTQDSLKAKTQNARDIYKETMHTTGVPIKDSIIESITLIDTSNKESKKRLTESLHDALSKLESILSHTQQ